MKKVLSLLMMAMLAIGAWAGEVTFDFNNDLSSLGLTAPIAGNGTNLETPITYGGVTMSFTNGGTATRIWNSNGTTTLRVYKNGGSLTFTADENFTSIVFNGTVTGSFDVGTFSSGEWTGNANSVTFTASANSTINSIVFTIGGEAPAVAAPTFSPAAGEVEAGTAVTISAPAAEMIVYTTDGTAPSYANNNGEIYTEPIVVNEAMTIKAIAVDANDNESAVATAAYTIKPEAVSVATVAEFNALADNTVFTFTGNLTVSGQKNSYLYAQDATGGILIYGSVGQTYTKGNVIPAGFGGKKTTYKGAPELASPTGFVAATTTVELSAEEITPAQVTLENAFKYAVIKGASINGSNLVVGDQSIAYYNSPFGTTVPTDNNTYDVYGINGFYNNPQFLPLEFVANAVEVATPVITGETPFTESTEVSITCETEGASIYYTIDGTDPTNASTPYTEAFTLTESATVKAIAYDATGATSSIASKEFVKTISVATVAEFNALDDDTEFIFTGNLVVSAQKNSYLYAQDATGGILIYGSVGQTYTKGNVIPAGFGGKKTTYKGAPELASPTGFVAATTTVELSAEEITPAQVTLENAFKYAVIKGASINGSNLVVGDQSIAYYNSPFGTTVPTDNNTYDVYGINGFYNNPQFLPLEFVEVVEPVHVYTAVGEPEVFFGSTWTPTAEDNDMTLNADTGVYEWTSPQATLNAGNKVQFKVVEDHSWDVNYGVDGALDGANVELTAEKTGIYTLTVYFDPQNNNNVTGELTLIKEIVPEYGEFYIVGEFNGWNQTEDGGRITLEDKGEGVYEATLNLEAGQEGEFKIITFNEDGSIKWFGGADDNNQNYFLINSDMLNIEISLIDGANFRPEEAGSYTIQIYEKPATAGLMAISEPLVMKVVKNQGTGITSVVNDIKGDNAWYNMQGVRFQNMPAAPGIYIHNGKKVIIK